MGQESREKLNNRDSISADLVDLNKWYQVIEKEGHLLLLPIIQKGVLILRNSEHDSLLEEVKSFIKKDFESAPTLVDIMTEKGRDGITNFVLNILHESRNIYIFFEVTEVEEEHINIEFDIVSRMFNLPEYSNRVDTLEEEWRWNYSLGVTVPIQSDGMEYGGEVYHYEDATLTIYEKQNRSEAEKDRYISKVLMGNKSYVHKKTVSWFFQIMAYLNYIIEHPELKELDGAPVRRKITGSSPGKDKKATRSEQSGNTPKVREVNLNSITVRTKASKTYNMLRSRQIHRVTASWGVRGHFRHYKNGKVVYIKPYTKGSDKDKRIKKNYQL